MNILDKLNSGKLNTFSITVIVICMVINLLDGYDILAISFTAPLISEEWTISPDALGAVFSSSLFGMAIGALIIGPYGDRIGRRPIILLCMIVVALAMLLTTFVNSVSQLMAVRFLTGLGIGGLLPSLNTIVAEYTPDKYRNISLSVMHIAYPAGAILSGVVVGFLQKAIGEYRF